MAVEWKFYFVSPGLVGSGHGVSLAAVPERKGDREDDVGPIREMAITRR